MNLERALESRITGTYTVTRRAASDTFDSNGNIAAGAVTTFSADMSISAVDGRELQSTEAAQSTKEERLALTTFALQTRRPGFVADQVTVDGEQWECISTETWAIKGFTHYRCRIARIPGSS